jgi:hypothetical protein
MAFLVVHPQLTVAHETTPCIVLYPPGLVDPDVVQQLPIADVAVSGSAQPILLLTDVDRRADLQDAMGQ